MRGLYYLGPLLKARDWEAIAVPELRRHAQVRVDMLKAPEVWIPQGFARAPASVQRRTSVRNTEVMQSTSARVL